MKSRLLFHLFREKNFTNQLFLANRFSVQESASVKALQQPFTVYTCAVLYYRHYDNKQRLLLSTATGGRRDD